MIEGIEQAMNDLKTIESNMDAIRKRDNDLRFENQKLRDENAKLRGNLANALETIERYQREAGESPHV